MRNSAACEQNGLVNQRAFCASLKCSKSDGSRTHRRAERRAGSRIPGKRNRAAEGQTESRNEKRGEIRNGAKRAAPTSKRTTGADTEPPARDKEPRQRDPGELHGDPIRADRSGEEPAHISKRQRDPGQTSKGNRSESRESITGTTCKGAGHGREIPEPIRGAEEPARGSDAAEIESKGSRIPENWKNTQRQQHRPKRGQQGTPIREPCNGWEILAENRRKSP